MKSKNKPRTLRVEDNRFSGIIVTLKKRMHIPLYEGKDDFGYTLFGHYDGMEIREVNNWFKFLPAGIENKKSETEIKDNVLDIYTLKACVPVNSTELEEMGFRYDIWGDEPLKAADGGEFLLSYPLVACSLLHLRKECVAETDINNLINEISGKISKSADLKKLNCGIFFSIGYSDIILLFRVNDFKYVDQALSKLNKSKINNSKIISDSYTITGFSNKVFADFDAVKAALTKYPQDHKKFEVAFSLHENVNVDEFAMCLKSEVSSLCTRISYDYMEGKTVGSVFSVFGNADAVVELNMPIYVYMALYMSESQYISPFCITHQLHKMATIQSTAMIPVPMDIKSEKTDFPDGGNKNNVNDGFADCIEQFSKFAAKYGITHRNVVAIKQLIKTYYNLIISNHGFEIKKIVGKVFEVFFANLNVCMKDIDNIYKNFSEVKDPDIKNKKRNEYIRQIENLLESIEMFRDFIGTYLSDLSRSDRSFIEGRAMKHPSIGSLTKLLFAYNQFINQLVYDVEKENSKNYAFVVVSGGCDATKVHEIFAHINNKDGYKHLYIITLPEICLFDFSGTLFVLSHECYHCVGPKYREERYRLLAKAACRYIADTIAKILIIEGTPECLDYFERGEHKEIKDKLESLRWELKNVLSAELSEMVDAAVEKTITIVPDKDKAFRYEKSISSIKEMLDYHIMHSVEQFPERHMAFYDIVSQETHKTLEKLFDYLVSTDGVFSMEEKIEFNDVLSELTYYNKNKVAAEKMRDAYNYMLKKIFIAFASSDELKAFERFETINEKRAGKLQKHEITSSNHMIRYIMETMCECYADCAAHKRLGSSLPDFLFCFLYQTWDINRAFPANITTVLRIGIDLKKMYKIEHELGEDDKQAIFDKFISYEKLGLMDRDIHSKNIDPNGLIEWINYILREYEKYSYFAEPIERYIDLCDKNSCLNDNTYSKEYGRFSRVERLDTNAIFDFIDRWRRFTEEEQTC